MQGWACYTSLERSGELFKQENNKFCADNPNNNPTPKTRKEFLCPIIVQMLISFRCAHSDMDKGSKRGNYSTCTVNQLLLISLDLFNFQRFFYLKISAAFPFCFLAKAFAYGGTSCCQEGMQTLKSGKHSEDSHMDKRTPVGVDYVRSSVIIEVRKHQFMIIRGKKSLGKLWNQTWIGL